LHVFGSFLSGSNPWILNLSTNFEVCELIFRCARLDAISLDVLHDDTKFEHHEYQLLSIVISLVNSFAGFALSALSTLRNFATFSGFDPILRDPRAVHQLKFFIVKIWLRVLFTNFQPSLGNSAIFRLEIEGLLFSGFDIALAMSEGGSRVLAKKPGYISSLSSSQTQSFTDCAV
jgi:hypothetical protein